MNLIVNLLYFLLKLIYTAFLSLPPNWLSVCFKRQADLNTDKQTHTSGFGALFLSSALFILRGYWPLSSFLYLHPLSSSPPSWGLVGGRKYPQDVIPAVLIVSFHYVPARDQCKITGKMRLDAVSHFLPLHLGTILSKLKNFICVATHSSMDTKSILRHS